MHKLLIMRVFNEIFNCFQSSMLSIYLNINIITNT
jgi:hypothetical protein